MELLITKTDGGWTEPITHDLYLPGPFGQSVYPNPQKSLDFFFSKQFFIFHLAHLRTERIKTQANKNCGVIVR